MPMKTVPCIHVNIVSLQSDWACILDFFNKPKNKHYTVIRKYDTNSINNKKGHSKDVVSLETISKDQFHSKHTRQGFHQLR